ADRVGERNAERGARLALEHGNELRSVLEQPASDKMWSGVPPPRWSPDVMARSDRPVADRYCAPGFGELAREDADAYRQAHRAFGEDGYDRCARAGFGDAQVRRHRGASENGCLLVSTADQLTDRGARPRWRHLWQWHPSSLVNWTIGPIGPDRLGDCVIRGRRSRSPDRRQLGPGGRPTRKRRSRGPRLRLRRRRRRR